AASAAVFLRDGDADPTARRHGPVEVPREEVLLVAAAPVAGVEVPAHPLHTLADRTMILAGLEVHVAPYDSPRQVIIHPVVELDGRDTGPAWTGRALGGSPSMTKVAI